MPPLHRGRTGDLRVVVNVTIPRKLTGAARPARAARRLARGRRTCASDEGMLAKLRRAVRRVIRLAVRVARRRRGGVVLAELLELSPGRGRGADARRRRRRVRDLRRAGRAARAARRSRRRSATCSSRCRSRRSPTTGHERWKEWHRPVDVSWRFRRLRVRPPWEARSTIPTSSSSSSIPGRRSAPARTPPRGCAWSCCCRSSPAGPFADWGCGTGVLAHRRRAARLSTRSSPSTSTRYVARGRRGERGRQRRRARGRPRQPAREPGPAAPTVVREPPPAAAARRRRADGATRPSS